MIDIQSELIASREFAERGEQLARESFDKLKSAIDSEKQNLRRADSQQQNNRLANERIFRDQLDEINRLELTVKDGIDRLEQRKQDFTVVLYGRTMVGKSTLMEIFTHGNGSSIGKGSQRTTRDVRDYDWNGLRIFDTPGVCSFGGAVDDSVALNAANNADLAIFMISDDGVQYEEAQRLSQLKKLGKPVLGIVNVKYGLSDRNNAKRKIDIKQVEKKLADKSRVDVLVQQLKDFSSEEFKDIPFIYAHLQSAFFSQQENDPSLYQLSNFAAVENFILEKVQADGGYFRFKTYVDAVARPMDKAIAAFYNHAAASYSANSDYHDTYDEFHAWWERFVNEIDERLKNFRSNLYSQFNNTIEDFVDDNYDSSSSYVESQWSKRLDRMNISGKCQDFIRELGNDAQYNLRRFNDRLNDQLSSSFDSSSSKPQFSAPILPDMTDYNDGLKTAALVLLPFSAPLAIAAGVLSFFFESRSEKIRKQKNKLRSALQESRDDLLPKVMSQLVDIINARIHHEMLGGFSDKLIARGELLFNSAQAQEKVADTINEQYRDLNFENLIEALRHVNNPRGLGTIVTSRTFGEELIVFSTIKMLEGTQQSLSKLLGEKVRAFEYREDHFSDDVRDTIRRSVFDRRLRQQLLWSPTGEV